MKWTVLLGLLATACVAGCGPQPYVTEARLQRGLVVVLPGIEGRGPLNAAVVEGLNAGGVNWAIQVADWTSVLGPLYNLRAVDRNRRQAAQIAADVAAYRRSHPGRPVVLVGHSGGGAIAAWAAEALPAGHHVDGIIMLAPSLVPQYRLSKALAASRRGIVNFSSRLDWAFLGLGTALAGTMDGRRGPSAGAVGFQVPPGARMLYEKLYQVTWRPEMAATGHVGGHFSATAPAFVAEYVAPFVLAPDWDWALVRRVLRSGGGAQPPDRGNPALEDLDVSAPLFER